MDKHGDETGIESVQNHRHNPKRDDPAHNISVCFPTCAKKIGDEDGQGKVVQRLPEKIKNEIDPRCFENSTVTFKHLV
jgi:hypothetical protein